MSALNELRTANETILRNNTPLLVDALNSIQYVHNKYLKGEFSKREFVLSIGIQLANLENSIVLDENAGLHPID